MNLKLLLSMKWRSMWVLLIPGFLCIPSLSIAQEEIGQIIEKEFGKIENELGTPQDKMSFLLHGKIHVIAEPFAKGNPYYPTDTWTEGQIITPNFTFENVAIRYDAFLDRLTYLSENSSIPAISLNPKNIGGFVIQGNTFEYLYPSNKQADEGYFQLVYQGKTSLYQKHFSRIQRGGDDPYGKYILKNKYYIWKSDQLLPLRKKKDLFTAFPGSEEKVKSYLKEKSLSLRTATAQQLVSLLTYLDQS